MKAKMKENKLIENLNWREATKIFDENKKISDDDLNVVLESARLSPSSFGIEPWNFIVIKNKKLKQKIQEFSYGQTQVGQNDSLIILLYKKNIGENSNYVKELLKKRIPENLFDKIMEMYNNFIKNKTQEQINAFANNQTHIAAGFMMTTLANLKIDSCPIGGFIEEEILKILEKNPNNYGVSMLLPIGYRLKNGREKTRRNFNEIVEIRE